MPAPLGYLIYNLSYCMLDIEAQEVAFKKGNGRRKSNIDCNSTLYRDMITDCKWTLL